MKPLDKVWLAGRRGVTVGECEASCGLGERFVWFVKRLLVVLFFCLWGGELRKVEEGVCVELKVVGGGLGVLSDGCVCG